MRAWARHALVVVLALAPSCKAKVVDLGADEKPVDAAPPPVVDANLPDVADASTTLETRLRALCKEPTGLPDRYASALELSNRLVGRWFLCDDPLLSPLGDPAAVDFGADGNWAALGFDESRNSLVPLASIDERGAYEYAEAAIGPDAGDAGTKTITRDDPTERGGLFVALHRGISTDIVVIIDFEAGPRRMLLRNAGVSKNSAFYVRIP